ncbi:MAG: F0F1 ATP synthase subunit A [Anaerolinea sp.]|nr:F0F1 ATP synthase subunit A [Anaerolinea sp.]MCC6975147.1 F0F1 ATP synthase subunit A [Anaerolineae bacterium]CAG0960529.1 ATP synthase subunit a [Anaerolineae bacterium]
MSATVRGLLIFIGLVVFVALACVGPAFFWLPNAGNGVGLPVITMPAEIIAPRAFLGGLDITNTLTSLILVDLILIVIAVVVGRALRTAPPDRYVPRGFSNFIEMIGEFLYNQAHNLLGAKYTRWAFPIAATIFLFLLTANLSKLIPGFESVGIVACAEYNAAAPDTDPIAAGQNGYPVKGLSASDPAARPIMSLFIDGKGDPANATDGQNDPSELGKRTGSKATRADTLKCEETYPWAKPPIAQKNEDLFVENAQAKLATFKAEKGLEGVELYERMAETELESYLKKEKDAVAAGTAFDEEAAKKQFEKKEPWTALAEEAKHLKAEGKEVEEKELLKEIYHHQLIEKAGGEEAVHAASADKLMIIPFFRGLTTDLNVPLALALVVFLLVEFWGLRALGLPYLFKFINLPALGNLGKKPLGAIDFIVGIIEIISELSRLVSLTFRLFGALFAGGILLIVFSFLVAFFAPVPIYLLELVIGGMQAYVFAILTIIYASQAVISHHHEEEHAHAEEHHEHH